MSRSENLMPDPVLRLLLSVAAVATITSAYRWLHVSNAAIVSITYLIVVLVVAATSRFWVAVATSLAAMLCLNFFFLPPLGTFVVTDAQNWVVLFAFLAVSLVASNLSAVARARTDEAVLRRDELVRLFDLSRDVLLMTDSEEAKTMLARAVARRFDLEFVALALPGPDGWQLFPGGERSVPLDVLQLSTAFAAAQRAPEFNAYERTYSGQSSFNAGAETVRLVPLRVGTKPVGMMAAAGRPIEAGTLDALGGVVAIAIERAQMLDERKRAELTRQSEELKTALLASLGHDLRTPLTAIRVAAGNLKASWLGEAERSEQADLVIAEVARLSRLFQNVLEMARIDAGAVKTEARWSHPSEIVSAAREQVEHSLTQHRIEITTEPDQPVRLDPRLTASALAHLLENAGQYAPPGSVVHVHTSIVNGELNISVRDHGPGLTTADLPHVFDRFFRGTAAKSRASGTGMGLWIARGLLAAEGGQLRAQNCAEGGAEFTIVVPAHAGEPAVLSPSAP
jgi:two-component system sensor histidine kinase KdpD